jgi:indole-3-acetate monooxygenase
MISAAQGWRMDTQDRPDPLATARDLGPAIAAASDTIESTRRIPEPLLTQLHESRLFRLLLPRSCGGQQTAPGTCLLVIEEIARHDASVAWNAFVANSAALIAAFLELDVAQAIFGDARTLVAWGPPNATRVCRRGRLSGERYLGFRQR